MTQQVSIPDKIIDWFFDAQVWWYGVRHREEISRKTLTDTTASVRSLLNDEPATKEVHELFEVLDKIDARDGGK